MLLHSGLSCTCGSAYSMTISYTCCREMLCCEYCRNDGVQGPVVQLYTHLHCSIIFIHHSTKRRQRGHNNCMEGKHTTSRSITYYHYSSAYRRNNLLWIYSCIYLFLRWGNIITQLRNVFLLCIFL